MENPMSSFGSEAETTVPRKNLKKFENTSAVLFKICNLKRETMF